jgi:RNA polymerase sigma-70 factor (ECF subfamily)
MIDIKKQTNLLLLLRKGDDCAFSEIYNIYWDKIYYLAYKKLNNIESAEEIVREVFLTIWKKLTINNLSNYLAVMIRNSVYRYLARESQSVNREAMFRRFFGAVSKSKNLSEFLKIMESTKKVRFKMEGG